MSSGLGLAVQLFGNHVGKTVAQEHYEGTNLGTVLSLLKAFIAIMCVASMIVSFCAWKIVRARPDIDDLYDVLHGMVHDANEVRRSMELMEVAHRNLLNERMESLETRLMQVQQALGRIEVCLSTRVEERQYELSDLSLGVPSDFSGNS